MPSHERLIILVSLTIVGLVLALVIKSPPEWLLVPVLTSMVWIGTDGVIRAHPKFRPQPFPQHLTFWILPTSLILGASLLLPKIATSYELLGGVFATALLLAATVILQSLTLESEEEFLRRARFGLHFATYLIALSLFSGLYSIDLALIPSILWTALISFFLTIELLQEHHVDIVRAWLCAASVGLVLGETRWALSYWPLSGLNGGVFLLLIFYLATGLIHSHLVNRLTKGTIIEFAVVTALGFAFLLGLRPW
ncbi:MAG: hypothetical protein HY664_06465 [Chloroflexi bacterium]|nr:hypothetical protein [Chloroflexota bacterium]